MKNKLIDISYYILLLMGIILHICLGMLVLKTFELGYNILTVLGLIIMISLLILYMKIYLKIFNGSDESGNN